MENLEMQSQMVAIPALSLSNINISHDLSAQNQETNLEKFLPVSFKGAPNGIDKMAEIIQSQQGFDYNQVFDIVKNLKSQFPEKKLPIESLYNGRKEHSLMNLIPELTNPLNKNSSFIDSKKNEESEEEEDSEDDLDDYDSNHEQNIHGSASKKNLIDNVKENLDSILQADGGKKKFTEKRWWTPEEVHF